MLVQSQEAVFLMPGEFYTFDSSNSYQDCAFIGYNFGNIFSYQFIYQFFTDSLDCSANLTGLKFDKKSEEFFPTRYNSFYLTTWIRQNSTIYDSCYSSDRTNCTLGFNVDFLFPSESFTYPSCAMTHNITQLISYEGKFDINSSGLYDIYPSAYTNQSYIIVNITRSIPHIIEKVPYSQFTQGTNIANLDAIIYEATGIVDDYDYNSCFLIISCYYNPVWPILFFITVFLFTLSFQVLLLFCIHRI